MILFYVSVAVISTSTPLTCFHGAVVWKPRRSLAAHTEPAGRPDLSALPAERHCSSGVD
jgi:hypothetical protein